MMEPGTKQMIERVVCLTINGIEMPSFICTPAFLDELAVGFLLTQKQIRQRADITDIQVDDLAVAVTTREPLPPALSVEARIEALAPVKRVNLPSDDEIDSLMGSLMTQDTYFGAHTLGLQTPEGTIFRQDIGRHNAMDKVIGRALLDGTDFSRCRIAATGRISLEMLLKAAEAGVPMIFSKKYPSDLAASLAERLGITIVAYALKEKIIVHTA